MQDRVPVTNLSVARIVATERVYTRRAYDADLNLAGDAARSAIPGSSVTNITLLPADVLRPCAAAEPKGPGERHRGAGETPQTPPAPGRRAAA
ncbi:hypothetical protein EVAR_9360_1 [Eumeta japonica]|uniref:Uncharacterized protein n=1 Tax=Eumeta variegata TaxID=151549 RepID=A0A4C1YTW9_EUMVA|nr:hypothetical protein EVAR_9360_1 [Eumeta japonica]